MKKRKCKPGGRKKHRKGAGAYVKADVRKDELDESVVMSGGLAWHSRYWAPRINEADSFGPVTITNSKGDVIRVIAKEELLRPTPMRPGNTWNNCLFPKRVSDKV